MNLDKILYERYAIAEQPILAYSNLLQPHTQITAVDSHMAAARGGSDKTPITVSCKNVQEHIFGKKTFVKLII
jgi:hypothetical protein